MREALISGGGQERGSCSGTLAPALVVGLGKACAVAGEEMENDLAHVERLSKRLIDGIAAKCEHIQLNGDATARYPGNVNMSFAYVEGESLLMAQRDRGEQRQARVHERELRAELRAEGVGRGREIWRTRAFRCHRLGRFTTEEEVDRAIELTRGARGEAAGDVARCGRWSKRGSGLKSIQWSQH